MKYLIALSFAILFSFTTKAQDLLDSLMEDAPKTKELTTASFKGTRLINLQTIETLGKGSLDFRISHRFGDFRSGANNLWGFDGPATLRLGLDYSITDRFTVGVGRSSYGKLFDGFLKYRILRQTTNNSMPISVTGITSMNLTSERDPNKGATGIDKYAHFSSRISYMTQLLIARKFSRRLTLQVAPTYIHYNIVTHLDDKNDIVALGGSGRFKITKTLSITGEYIARLNDYTVLKDVYHNSASIGLDIETGGHVFQLFVTNSIPINEVQVIPFTASSWEKGQIRFGFNVSRVFGLGGY